MIRELKSSHAYPKVMLFLSVLTLLFGFCFCFLGEIFLPFAVSFLAALFIFEKPKKRVLSYIVPIIPVICAVLSFGVFALITAQYIAFAAILALCYRYSRSKAYCAFYMTFAISLMLIVSLYVSGAMKCGSFAPHAVTDYYSTFYTALKAKIIDFASNYTVTNRDGSIDKPFTKEIVAELIDALSKLAVGIIGIYGFICAGIAIKIFTFLILRYSKHGILKTFAHFLPSNAVAYVYIVLAILSALIGSTDIVDLAIINVCQIFMIVFAYMGVQYVFAIAKFSGRRSTVLTFLVAGILVLNVVALQLLSFLGVWITIGTNRSLKPIDEE